MAGWRPIFRALRFPNISVGAHALLAEASSEALRTATSTIDGPAQKQRTEFRLRKSWRAVSWEYFHRKSVLYSLRERRQMASEFANIGTDPFLTIIVENEAPGKRSVHDLHRIPKRSSKAKEGCFHMLHWQAAQVFLWPNQSFLRASGPIRSKYRLINMLIDAYIGCEWVTLSTVATDHLDKRRVLTCDRMHSNVWVDARPIVRQTCIFHRPHTQTLWITIAAIQWQILAMDTGLLILLKKKRFSFDRIPVPAGLCLPDARSRHPFTGKTTPELLH